MSTPNRELPMMAWSDNLYTIGDSIESAIGNFNHWRQILCDMFGMHVKDDSCFVVPARTRQQGETQLVRGGVVWRCVDEVRSLGVMLTDTGQDHSELKRLQSSWTRAFWVNVSILTNSVAPALSRLKFWRR